MRMGIKLPQAEDRPGHPSSLERGDRRRGGNPACGPRGKASEIPGPAPPEIKIPRAVYPYEYALPPSFVSRPSSGAFPSCHHTVERRMGLAGEYPGACHLPVRALSFLAHAEPGGLRQPPGADRRGGGKGRGFTSSSSECAQGAATFLSPSVVWSSRFF